MRAARSFVFALVWAALAGCASTRLADAWRDAGYTGPGVRKVVVFAQARDATDRRLFEDAFAIRFIEKGIDAVPSYRLLPDGEQLDEAALRAAVRDSGADGLVLTQIVGVEERLDWTPAPYVGASPFYGDFFTGYGVLMGPVVTQSTVVRVSTRLYVAEGDGRLVFAARTSTLDPHGARSMAREVAGEFIGALRKAGLA